MAQITIDIPDAYVVDIRDTLCAEWGYQAEIPNPDTTVGGTIPNPETKGTFLKRRFAALIKEHYTNVKVRQAANTAVIASQQTAQTIAIN